MTDSTLLAELQQHLTDHTPSCNARTDHLMRRAAWALGLPRPAHNGGNAEDCPGCEGTNPPYPFICPGPNTAEGSRGGPLGEQQLAEIVEMPRAEDIAALVTEVRRLHAELERRTEDLAFLERATLRELRREIEHHKAGKQRWRDRAETAEARVAEARTKTLCAEADAIVLHCPDHSPQDQNGVWMDCHCAVADDMRHRAAAGVAAANTDGAR